jgi:hypothetical protein
MLIPVDASLHIGLDKYDLFAITASLETCKNLKDYLNEDFANRQAIANSGGRNFDRQYRVRFNLTSLSSILIIQSQHLDFEITLQFVPLHPYQICPRGWPLLRRDQFGTCRSYLVCEDRLFRETNSPEDVTATPFPTFEHQTERIQKEKLNIWFVMLNAEIKFRRFIKNYGESALHPDLLSVVKETIEIVQLVYKKLNLANIKPTRRSKRNTNKSPISYEEREESGTDTEREPDGGGDEAILRGEGQSSGWGNFQRTEFPIDRWTSDLATRPGRPSCAFFFNVY